MSQNGHRSEHRITLDWQRSTPDFAYDTFSRDHQWHAGPVTVPASSAGLYAGSGERVDPEQTLVAALSSCHMLTFLALAARKRLVVDRYDDEAVGVLAANDEGRMAVVEVVLRPRVVFAGEPPDEATIERMHDKAHQHCFIANSIKSDVRIEPR